METMRQGTEAVADPLERSFFGHIFTWRTDIGAPFGTQLSLSLPSGAIIAKDIAEEVTAVGLGDLEIRLRQNLATYYHDAHLAIPRVRLSVGVVLPTGEPVNPDETEANNAAKAAEAGLLPSESGNAHGHGVIPDTALGVYNVNAALGMGTTWLLAEIDLWWDVHPDAVVFLSSQNRIALHESSVGMVFGPEIRGMAGASTSIIAEWLTISAALELMWRGRHFEVENGHEEELLNSGGLWFSVVPAVEFRIASPLAIHLGARIPIMQDVRGYQITDDWSVFAGITGTFALSKPSSASEGAELPYQSADSTSKSMEPKVAVAGGKAFEVADILVPNKVTVIDYFAEWCVPCIALGKELDMYVRENPNVVIQRVDIVDWESPAVQAHIKSELGIPILDIYDAQGRFIKRLVQGETARFREIIDGIQFDGGW